MAGVKITRSIMVTRKRDLGAGGEIMVSLQEADVLIASQNSVFGEMTKAAENMLDAYMEQYGKEIKLTGNANGLTTISTVRHIATGISVTMRDGLKLYRVKGGKYSEHGVPFYAEHMEACGINAENIPDEGYKFKGKTFMVIEMEGGTAKRVIRLEKDE